MCPPNPDTDRVVTITLTHADAENIMSLLHTNTMQNREADHDTWRRVYDRWQRFSEALTRGYAKF